MTKQKSRSARHNSLLAASFAASMIFAGSAQADLIYLGQQDLTGTGLGAVPTILTLQGNPATAGSVTRSGGADVKVGDLQNAQTKTIQASSLADLDQGSELRLVFNGSEPQGGGQATFTINTLSLLFYDMADALLATFSFLGGPLTITPSTGTGKSGDVFGLDFAQAAQLTTLLQGNPDGRFGLSTTVSNEQGGLDTFFLNVVNAPGVAVPEPATLGLLGMGLLGLGAAARSRRKSIAA